MDKVWPRGGYLLLHEWMGDRRKEVLDVGERDVRLLRGEQGAQRVGAREGRASRSVPVHRVGQQRLERPLEAGPDGFFDDPLDRRGGGDLTPLAARACAKAPQGLRLEFWRGQALPSRFDQPGEVVFVVGAAQAGP